MKDHTEAGATDFRRDLTRHLIAAEHGGKATIVTRNGHPAAVLMPWDTVVRASEGTLDAGQVEALHRLSRLQTVQA